MPIRMTDSIRRHTRAIPASIWVLGFVSLLMDVSSEMIHALFPVYLVTVLGASALTVGVIEGVAEATASITKVFSGAWDMYDVNRVVRFLHFRVQGSGPWALAGISIYGRAAGRR